MQDDIERFLEGRSPNCFSVTEIALEMGISRSSAQRQLKKLLAKERIVMKEGKFGKEKAPGPGRTETNAPDVDEIARRVGLDPRMLERWVEEKKARVAEKDSTRALKKILRNDAEQKPRPKGKEHTD